MLARLLVRFRNLFVRAPTSVEVVLVSCENGTPVVVSRFQVNPVELRGTKAVIVVRVKQIMEQLIRNQNV